MAEMIDGETAVSGTLFNACLAKCLSTSLNTWVSPGTIRVGNNSKHILINYM